MHLTIQSNEPIHHDGKRLENLHRQLEDGRFIGKRRQIENTIEIECHWIRVRLDRIIATGVNWRPRYRCCVNVTVHYGKCVIFFNLRADLRLRIPEIPTVLLNFEDQQFVHTSATPPSDGIQESGSEAHGHCRCVGLWSISKPPSAVQLPEGVVYAPGTDIKCRWRSWTAK